VSAVTLVACVASKLEHAAPARELYTSAWFRKARAYAEAAGRPWFILSAKHFLVDPLQVVEPYDATLVGADRDTRRWWAWHTAFALRQACTAAGLDPSTTTLEVLAGEAYRAELLPALRARGFRDFSVPMAGLGIGEQLHWLGTRATA